MDARAETIDLDNDIGADGRARRADADTDAVAIAPPRVRETITSAGPRDHLPAQQLLIITKLREPDAPASALTAKVLSSAMPY